VGVTNWRSWTTGRKISFADKLGLSAGTPYIVFDFWKQTLLGVFTDSMDVEIEPHDTRVLLVHPVLHRPQLIATSRHITGAYSIRSLAWDASKKTLRGSSQAVAGAPYTLWFYVPDGVTVSKVQANGNDRQEFTLQHKRAGDSLQIRFQGQEKAVDWEVEFKAVSAQ
jgi:phage protein U